MIFTVLKPVHFALTLKEIKIHDTVMRLVIHMFLLEEILCNRYQKYLSLLEWFSCASFSKLHDSFSIVCL